jgi:hypothetical protein
MSGPRDPSRESSTRPSAALTRVSFERCRDLLRVMSRKMCTAVSRLRYTLVTGKNWIHLHRQTDMHMRPDVQMDREGDRETE